MEAYLKHADGSISDINPPNDIMRAIDPDDPDLTFLIGGGSDQMLAYLIAEFATNTANWGLAGALAILLLLCIAVLYPLYHRFAGAGGMKLG